MDLPQKSDSGAQAAGLHELFALAIRVTRSPPEDLDGDHSIPGASCCASVS